MKSTTLLNFEKARKEALDFESAQTYLTYEEKKLIEAKLDAAFDDAYEALTDEDYMYLYQHNEYDHL